MDWSKNYIWLLLMSKLKKMGRLLKLIITKGNLNYKKTSYGFKKNYNIKSENLRNR